MFSTISNRLTAASHYLIDWSRIGELLASGSHHYTQEQITARGLIIFSISASAYLGAYLNDESKTGCTSTACAIVGGLLGFTLSHFYIIKPLIDKRYQMSVDCQNIAKDIKQSLVNTEGVNMETVDALIEKILNVSLANEKHSNASLTWGKRKRLLENLRDSINQADNQELISLLKGQYIDVILTRIDNPLADASVGFRRR